MAGVSKLFVVGDPGGYMGSDGVNPIHFFVLVGDGDRQWLEPHYVDTAIIPIGQVRSLIPAEPNHADALLDACIAFGPRYFTACPSLAEVRVALQSTERLDFHQGAAAIPRAWARLREEARPLFAAMSIWQADLTPSHRL